MNTIKIAAFAVGVVFANGCAYAQTVSGIPTNPNSGFLCNKFNMPGHAEPFVIAASHSNMWTTLEAALHAMPPRSVTIQAGGSIDCNVVAGDPPSEFTQVFAVKE
jgi:hypothetical protein